MTWDWNAELTLSRALVLQVSPEGALLAVSSISHAHLHLVPDSMLVLLSFAGGVPAHEALGRLQDRYQVDSDAFQAAAQQLIDAGFIVPAHGQQAAAPATGHFADVLNHVAMLADSVRVDAYRHAIQRNVRGRTVLELGCGTGLLSLLCAQYGARSVVAVEESSIADIAAAHFADHQDVITLVRRSSRDVTLREPVDVIVHELIGGDPLAEGLLPSICDARRRLLAPGGRLLPHRLELLCVGVAVADDDTPADRPRALAEIAALSRWGVNFHALADAITALPARAFIHTLRDVGFVILTEPCLLHDLDLMTVTEDAVAAPVARTLEVTRAGRLGAVLLFFRAHLDDHGILANAPDAAPTHWGRRITALSASRTVAPGDRVPIMVAREAHLAHERLIIDVAGGAAG